MTCEGCSKKKIPREKVDPLLMWNSVKEINRCPVDASFPSFSVCGSYQVLQQISITLQIPCGWLQHVCKSRLFRDWFRVLVRNICLIAV